jgi:hypothetical protein
MSMSITTPRLVFSQQAERLHQAEQIEREVMRPNTAHRPSSLHNATSFSSERANEKNVTPAGGEFSGKCGTDA